MSDEDQNFGIVHAGFAMSSLPHREPGENLWVRHSGAGVKLRVRSGLDQNDRPVGIPYGATARMILLYLQSRAVAQKTREIELGKSMYDWLNRMGVPRGGATYGRVREQAKRLSYCQLTFFRVGADETELTNGSFVRNAILSNERGPEGQGALWRDTVILDEAFYQSLIEHPLPVREAAIASLSARSVAIDVYVWLAYRLYQLAKPTPISWAALMDQFGHSYDENLRGFRREFKVILQLALAAYDGAKIAVTDAGVTLYPSPPAVPTKAMGTSAKLIPSKKSED
jgi:hypothetical protein